jgi:hypothetical protein
VTGLILVIPVVASIFVSYLIVRAGAVALMLTGLDTTRARFQALSAFTGTGFTTMEAESVIDDPGRRRIISWLMILGNAGIASVIVSVASSIITSEGCLIWVDILAIVIGVFIMYQLIRRNFLARSFDSFIEKRIVKAGVSGIETEQLFLLGGSNGLVRVFVRRQLQITGKTLLQLNLTSEHNLSVLGIERKGSWINFPASSEVVMEGDKLIIYGNVQEVMGIFQ